MLSALFSAESMAGAKDDPLLAMLKFDQLETRQADAANPLVLEADAWVGYDLHKLWLKMEFEHVDKHTEEAELQALYARAIVPYWDLQLGLRKDFRPQPSRNWAVIGVQGLAPYYFEIDTALFIGESGRTALRLEVEYELLFTQRIILSPLIELNIHGQTDAATGVGSGLSDAEIGLRLRYEIRREIAPYIGVNWVRKFGKTADFAKLEGDDSRDTQLVLGLRLWF